ncbi:hypothetical protein OEZ86_007960 [Tetradesmus obliquus]|nr:hypothetical protein OEZ86_007960 [Tetradesmus obliquus]
MSPRMRPVFQPDATIAYPTVGDHDMPFVVALLVPFVVLVLTALAVECLWFKHGCQRRTITLINLLLTFMAAVAVVGFMTELFKRLAGRLRPDFLSRCQNADNMDAIDANTGLPGLQLQTGCTNMDIKALEDGRMSFPSGHSSCSMAVGLYAALYMLWSLHWREGGALHRALMRPASSFMGRIGKDVASLVVLLVLLFQIAWPWGVALSRFIDNRHNANKSGKTNVLEKLKQLLTDLPGMDPSQIMPTVGLNVGKMEAFNSQLVFWDLGGQQGLRSIWDKYYAETHGLVFVVDATDPERFDEAKVALDKALGARELVGAPLLLIANKQDAEGAVDMQEVSEAFGLGKMDSIPCIVQPASAYTGQGLVDGIKWLVEAVKRSPRRYHVTARRR